MRILFLTDNFPPEVNAPASRTFAHCKNWVKHGHEVTVITCAPNFPLGKVYNGYKNKFYQKEWMEGIKVIRVWSYIAANEGFFKRTLDFISFVIFFCGDISKMRYNCSNFPAIFYSFDRKDFAFLEKETMDNGSTGYMARVYKNSRSNER